MVTTFRMIKGPSVLLLLAAATGCSGTQNGGTPDMACGEGTHVLFEPPLDEKGEHTVKVTYDESTVNCAFKIGDRVTPTDEARCTPADALLIIRANTASDSPTQGPDDFLPIVEGVNVPGYAEEVTVEVDGTSYGSMDTEHVEATKDSCAHYAATVQLD